MVDRVIELRGRGGRGPIGIVFEDQPAPGQFLAKAAGTDPRKFTSIPGATPANAVPLTTLAGSAGASLVGSKSNLPGSVTKSQSEINAEVVNVMRFGADPTGVTDSTAAFNRATGASELHTGNETNLKRRVVVPGGKYRLDNKVFIRRGQELAGAGHAATYYDFTQGSNGGFVLGCGSSGNVDPGGLGVSIRDAICYGNASPAVDASKPDSWKVIDMMFTACGVAVRAGGTDGLIDSPIVDGCDVGFDLVRGHGIKIQNPKMFANKTGFRFFEDVSDVLISDISDEFSQRCVAEFVGGLSRRRNIVFSGGTIVMNGQFETFLGAFLRGGQSQFRLQGLTARNLAGFFVVLISGDNDEFDIEGCEINAERTFVPIDTQPYDQSTTAGGVEVSNANCVISNTRMRGLKRQSIFCAPSAPTRAELKSNTFLECTGGAREITIIGGNNDSSIIIDPTNVSDRDMIPAQNNVLIYAKEAATGRATLIGGSITISLDIIRTSSRVMVHRYQDGGTVGASYSVERTQGNSFKIISRDGNGNQQINDTSIVDWSVDLRGI